MIAASIIDRIGEAKVIGFLNDIIPIGTKIGKYKQIEVIGKSSDLNQFIKDKDTYVFIAYVGLENEKEVYEKILTFNIPENKYYNIVDPSAIIPHEYCGIGNGVLLAPLV